MEWRRTPAASWDTWSSGGSCGVEDAAAAPAGRALRLGRNDRGLRRGQLPLLRAPLRVVSHPVRPRALPAYVLARLVPHLHHPWPAEGVLGRGGRALARLLRRRGKRDAGPRAGVARKTGAGGYVAGQRYERKPRAGCPRAGGVGATVALARG